MRSMIRGTASAILSAGLVLAATATAATAASDTNNDKHSDVWYYDDSDDEVPELLGHIASIRSGVDVRKFRLNHGKGYVSVRFDVVHLKDEGLRGGLIFQKDGQKGVRAWWAHFRFDLGPDPTGTIHPGTVTYKGDDEPLCTVDVKVTPARYGTVYAKIPRSCLGNPTTLRSKGASLTRSYKPPGDTQEESPDEESWSDSLLSTSWLKSG